MSGFQSSFKLKLLMFAGVLFVVVALLAALLFGSTQRYQYHLERSSVANRVLSSFQAVSDHAYRKLNAMEQIVALGQIEDVAARVDNEKALWAALAQARLTLQEELALDGLSVDESKQRRLSQLERLIEQIIQSGGSIRDAIKNGDKLSANQILNRVRSQSVAGEFNRLIDEALEIERQLVVEAQNEALSLSQLINRGVPIAVLVTLCFGLAAALLLSRGLTRSLDTLAQAADAYRDGNLEHRTLVLPEQEFSHLGEAFNRMAEELAARRQLDQQSQEQLEAQVQIRTQELAETLKQLEKVDASRRQLLADISHELRTPLTIVRGEADMALRGREKSAPEYIDALTRVRDQAIHTTRLVEDLLFVARAEEGNVRLETRPVAIVELMQEVSSDFRSALLKKGLEMNQQFPQERLLVQGDRGRLRQVLAILLDNAVRYASDQTEVTVQVKLAEQWVHIQINNLGIGLTEAEAKQVFYRFYRGDGAAGSAEGTGLGLPVAKAIVDAHGGTIGLTGKPGEGATATVHLPVEKSVSAVA